MISFSLSVHLSDKCLIVNELKYQKVPSECIIFGPNLLPAQVYNSIMSQEIWLEDIGCAIYKQLIDMSVACSVLDHRQVSYEQFFFQDCSWFFHHNTEGFITDIHCDI